MTVDHYDDEQLIAMAGGAAAGDAHLEACPECAAVLESYRVVSECLGEEAVWDLRTLREEPASDIGAMLRTFSEKLAAEEAEGERIVSDLLASPRPQWPLLAEAPRFRTAGVVRRLLEAIDRAGAPGDIAALTSFTVSVAEGLDAALYPGDTVAQLRGAAWRERSFALFYVGEIGEAEAAAQRAAAHFETCAAAEQEMARVELMFALIDRPLGRIDEALARIESAARTFREYGDVLRLANAMATKAYVLSNAQRYAEALEITKRVLAEHGEELPPRELAMLVLNVGVYAREVGDYDKALDHFARAARMFDGLGATGEVVRVRWNEAVVYLRRGEHNGAARRLSGVVADFRSLGMEGPAVVASLDLAETLLMQGYVGEVQKLCRAAIDHFGRSGLAYSSRAMTALAYLRDVTEAGQVSCEEVRYVRRYLDRLTYEPAVLFVPPPER